MTLRQNLLAMTAAAGLLGLPVYALAQQGGSAGGGSSMQNTTTQTTPQQGPISGSPGARAGAEAGGATGATVRGNNAGSAMGGAASDRQVPPNMQGQSHAQTSGSQAAERERDASGGVMAQGGNNTATPRDGSPGNPPGTAAGRATDRALGTNMSGANPQGDTTATGATSGTMAVDSAALRDTRRVSQIIGSNVYTANDESIGEVEDILIPQGGNGQPVAVISVGGFLGIGSKLVAVPYDRLQMNSENNRWTLPGANKESLNALPTFNYDNTESSRG